MPRYFEVVDHVDRAGRWFLGSPRLPNGQRVEPELFTSGRSVELEGPLEVSVRVPGEPLDWTFADFDMPVVSETGRRILELTAPGEVQFISANVIGVEGVFAIANVLPVRACVDEQRSAFLKWTAEDGRPDRIGAYRMVSHLRVEESRLTGCGICRVAGWDVAIVVAANVKEAMDAVAVRGLEFRRVD
jgi:hypothetical protein